MTIPSYSEVSLKCLFTLSVIPNRNLAQININNFNVITMISSRSSISYFFTPFLVRVEVQHLANCSTQRQPFTKSVPLTA